MKRKYSREEKATHLEQWRESGQSRVSYAREQGLAAQTFSKWVNESEQRRNGLVELNRKHTGDPKAGNRSSRLIIRKNDVSIHMPVDVEKEMLSYVIETLVQL